MAIKIPQCYIALGDSMSGDDYPGKNRGAASLVYKNHPDYAEFAGKDLHSLNPAISFYNLAQDGALSISILQIAQSEKMPESVEGQVLVSLTAGGNDLLRLLIDKTADPDTVMKNALENIQAIVAEVKKRYAGVKIALATIYDPSDGKGDFFTPGMVMPEALDLLNTFNEQIRHLANQDEAIALADVYQHFRGHRYDSKGEPAWYILPYEPGQKGASEIRRLFLKAFELF